MICSRPRRHSRAEDAAGTDASVAHTDGATSATAVVELVGVGGSD
jgi:hypothetical protein